MPSFSRLASLDQARLPATYFCLFCGRLLKEAMQTACGHFYCLSCLENVLVEAVPGTMMVLCLEDGCLISLDEVYEDNFRRREISTLIVRCVYWKLGCGWNGEVRRFEAHIMKCKHEQAVCPHFGCGIFMNKSALKDHIECHGLQRQLEAAQDAIRRLERRVESHDHSLAMRNVALADLEEFVRQQQVSSYDGALLWKIPDYARRKNDAVSGRQTSFYSPCFYTSRHGYKMCARLYLNGDGMGKGTHISVFFVIMRGQFDALLRWPFRQKVTIMLLDQDNVEHVIDAFRPDPNSSSFQRPRREMNVASGCPLFCSLSELSKHAYVRDDVMFMKFIVDISDL